MRTLIPFLQALRPFWPEYTIGVAFLLAILFGLLRSRKKRKQAEKEWNDVIKFYERSGYYGSR